MKPFSQQVYSLLTLLHEKPPLGSGIFFPHPAVELLGKIGASSEPAVVPHILPLLQSSFKAVREATATAIGRLTSDLHPNDLVEFDEWCRHDWYHSSLPSFGALKKSGLNAFRKFPNASTLLGIASCNFSGFIREKAVEELAKCTDGGELPYLLLRVNDWVNEVRQRAEQAIADRISDANVAHFLRNISLVLRLRVCSRGNHADLVEKIMSLLKSPAAVVALKAAIDSHNPQNQRMLLQVAEHSTLALDPSFVGELLSSADPMVRSWPIIKVLPRMDNQAARQLVEPLCADKSSFVRLHSLRLFVTKFDADAIVLLTKSLLDSNSTIRHFARFWIRKLSPEFDIASAYRNEIKPGIIASLLKAALCGLGETGTKQDCELIYTYLHDSRAGVCRAALRAIEQLNREQLVPMFLEFLCDKRPAISNEAARALGNSSSFDPCSVVSVFRKSPFPHVRRNALRLLLKFPFWQRGVYILEASRDESEIFEGIAPGLLEQWLLKSRSVAVAPTPLELKALDQEFALARAVLNLRTIHEIQLCLDGWRPKLREVQN